MQRTLPRESVVYRTFWYLAAERQRIFFRKIRGIENLTNDSILLQFRFTNAYRAADRVSQYLIRHVLYGERRSARDLFVRGLLFRIFNCVETWRFLENRFGSIEAETFNTETYGSALDDLMQRGMRVYSSAYIMPSGKSEFHHDRKHRNHLALVDLMLKTNAPERISSARSLREVYELLLSYPSLGPFLAFQIAIDLNYSELIDFSEMDFVVAGPGARSGIRKCFGDLCGWTEADLIRYIAENQEDEALRCGEKFLSLWGRRLQLIDVQNLFCETDKYARVRHPNICGLGERTRIKRNYSPSGERIDYWFPPKWHIDCRASVS